MNDEEEIKFPKGFLWGASTSAYQVEGGIKCDWSEWEESPERLAELEAAGEKAEDFICARACNSYQMMDEDMECIKKLNLKAYRFGVEWARIQPEKGVWEISEIEHYRQFLQKLKDNKIKTVVTLWHWTNPVWITQRGGWTNPKTIKYFRRYVRYVVKELGDLVDYWVTLNEPLVHVSNGYIKGKFPPNKNNFWQANTVFNNLVKAHKEAYKVIHFNRLNAKVGLTVLANYFEPARSGNLLDRLVSGVCDYFWNTRFLRKVKDSLDYIGVDYYFHDKVSWRPPFRRNENKLITDMGWEIYPEGIFHVLENLNRFGKRIIILENGLADASDKLRADFIKKHLYWVRKAIARGVKVRGYFHWSLLDNFEWAHGYAPKFGLFSVDKKTFKRSMKSSAKVYSSICKRNGWKEKSGNK